MFPLIWSLLKPYRLNLGILFLATTLQMLAAVAAPWPLKFVLDNVLGEHKLPGWADHLVKPFISTGSKMEIAAAAAIAVIPIAVLGALASYAASY